MDELDAGRKTSRPDELKTMVKRCSPEVTRARSRIVFFSLLTVCLLATGSRFSAGIAAAGIVAGLLSLRAAIAFGPSLAITFITVDWLALGLTIGIGGGLRSWLAFSVPILAFLNTAPGKRYDRIHRLAPAASLLAVLLIADPQLGGNRGLGVAMSAALVGMGALPLRLLERRPAARRTGRGQKRPLSVDPTTGLPTACRVAELLSASLEEATAAHEALSVACVRLDHFADTRTFLGAERAEALVAQVARRLHRSLRPSDTVFRVHPDTFLLVLPGRLPSQAYQEMNRLRQEIARQLVARQRQTISAGVASFPACRDLESLIREAHRNLVQSDAELRPAASL